MTRTPTRTAALLALGFAASLAPMSVLAEEGDALDAEVVEELAVQGEYSPGSIKALTKAVNSLLPSFGVEEKLDESAVSEDGTVPMEVSRYVLSIRDAVNDAIDPASVIPSSRICPFFRSS